ncbi:hypothetical protein, partial [Klebsiella pneumoniae]|uniref:hypothetical protein n=1 Tax=Klebsiella pneumoniae TaxID=573 RepID=UPI001C6FCF31
GAGRTSDGNGSHASTLKSPSYTKSVSWQHYPIMLGIFLMELLNGLSNKPDLAQKKGYKSTNKQKPG